MNMTEAHWRRGLGAAHAGVSLLAAVGLVALVGTIVRDSFSSPIHEYTEPVRHLDLAGGLYLAAFCVIHARWGALLRRGLRTGPAIALVVAAAHLSVAVAIVYVVRRRWDSRVLTAGFELPLAAWFTVAAAGFVLALASLILSCWTRRRAAEAVRGGALSGWQHLLPPLLLAALLVAALLHLESYPLPNSTPSPHAAPSPADQRNEFLSRGRKSPERAAITRRLRGLTPTGSDIAGSDKNTSNG